MSLDFLVTDRIDDARRQLHERPLSAKTLRALEALLESPPQERVVDAGTNYVANLVVRGANGRPLRFCEVSNEEEWRAVCALRKRCYPMSLPYLVNVLDEDGKDEFDPRSFVYAAFDGDRAVATIRATVYPYETLRYVDEAKLAAFLGRGWKSEYIEWGRLLVDRTAKLRRVTPALITYAGLRLMLLTHYRSYFGYTKPNVRAIISSFALQDEVLKFQIPSRGTHTYLLSRGSFGVSALRELPKWLRSAVDAQASLSSLVRMAA